MDVREYTNALLKQWYIVAIATLIAAIGGVYYANSQEPTYQATSKLFVSSTPGATIQDLVQGSNYTQNLVASYAALASMPVVLEPVIEKLGLETTARSLARSVKADAPLNTVILEVSVTSSDPKVAADISNAVSAQLSASISQLSPSAANDDPVRLEVVSPATEPTYPISPRKKLIVATFLIAGLAIGVVIAVLKQLLGSRLRTAEEISAVTPIAILGSIPRVMTRSGPAVTAYAPQSVAAEAYRRLQTNLQFLDISAPVRSLVVTSALGNEGKSMTSVNLAIAIAEKGKRVLLVDADMRKPSLAEYCQLEQAAGLSTVLIGRTRLDEVVQPWAQPTLDVLTSGAIPPNPSQLIDSPAMTGFLAHALTIYDTVIFDAPPLLPVSDGAVLARTTDGAVVVAGCHQVRRQHLTAALASLEAVGAKCLGIVANRTRARSSGTYYGEKPTNPIRRWAQAIGLIR